VGGHAVKSFLSAATTVWWKRLVQLGLGLVPLGRWSLPFNQEWWDHMRYGVYGSPTICHYRELGHIQILWAITDGPWYPGYRSPTPKQVGVG
jgi:hypothetical protein